jgi:thiamine-monophosphate kinase
MMFYNEIKITSGKPFGEKLKRAGPRPRDCGELFLSIMPIPSPSGEYALLAAIKKALGGAAAIRSPYALTIGDDAAVRKGLTGEQVVLTTDLAVENVHFSLVYMSMSEIGYRVIAANVSDCAAMACRPESALVQLVFPRKTPRLREKVVALYRGMAKACQKWNCRIVGGDLAGGEQWTIGITMLGTAPLNGRIITRKGARPGDSLWLCGFPGCSAAGLAGLQKWGRRGVPKRFRRLVNCHIRPGPEPDLGIALGKCPQVRAMMDLSDGISKDGRTLGYENRLGLDLSFEGISVPDDMAACARELGIPWEEWALHGGEEYSLLFAASPLFGPESLPRKYRAAMVRLGIFTARHRDVVLCEGRKRIHLPCKGWDHVK